LIHPPPPLRGRQAARGDVLKRDLTQTPSEEAGQDQRQDRKHDLPHPTFERIWLDATLGALQQQVESLLKGVEKMGLDCVGLVRDTVRHGWYLRCGVGENLIVYTPTLPLPSPICRSTPSCTTLTGSWITPVRATVGHTHGPPCYSK